MFENSIQKKLKQMERDNPSENEHPQGLLKTLKDRTYFIARYFGMEEKLNSFLGTDMFCHTPVKSELGETFYRAEQLGDLVEKSFPVTLTNNTRDGATHWSNDPRYVKSLYEMIKGRLFSSHTLQYVPVDGEYRFDCKPIK